MKKIKIKIEGHTAYRFIFSGMMWAFFVSSHKFPSFLKEAVLTEAGEMIIGKGTIEELVNMEGFALDLSKMGRINLRSKKV